MALLDKGLPEPPSDTYHPETAYGEVLQAGFEAYRELHMFARALYEAQSGSPEELSSPTGDVTVTYEYGLFSVVPKAVTYDGMTHDIEDPANVVDCPKPYDMASNLRSMHGVVESWADDASIDCQFALREHGLNLLNDLSALSDITLKNIERVVEREVSTRGALRVYLDRETLPDAAAPLFNKNRTTLVEPYFVAKGRDNATVVTPAPDSDGFWIDSVSANTPPSLRKVSVEDVQEQLHISGRFGEEDDADDVFAQVDDSDSFISNYVEGRIVRVAKDMVVRTQLDYPRFIDQHRTEHVEKATLERHAALGNDVIEERSLDGLVEAHVDGKEVAFSFDIPTKRVKKRRSRRNSYGSNYKTVKDYDLLVEVLYDELKLAGNPEDLLESDVSSKEHARRLMTTVKDQLRAQLNARIEAADEKPAEKVYNELEADLQADADEQSFTTDAANAVIGNAVVWNDDADEQLTLLAPEPTEVRVAGPVVGTRVFRLPAGIHTIGKRGYVGD